MIRARGRVVAEAGQRVIDALCRKRRKRRGLTRNLIIFTIRDQIVRVVKVRRIENIAKRHVRYRRRRGCLDMRAFSEGKMQRNRRLRFGNRDRYVVIAHQKAELFLQIMTEQFRPRDGGRVMARRRDMAIGQARIDMPEAGGFYAHLRIARPIATFDRLAPRQISECLDQEPGIALVKLSQRIHRSGGITEDLGLISRWIDEGGGRLGKDSFCHEPL